MNKRRQKIILVVAVLFIVIGIICFFSLIMQKAPNSSVKGRVTNVVSRPNQAEDGYYGITVQDGAGNDHTINATGYLNTPASPDQFGEACVDIPKVNVGDQVEFNLPKNKNQSNSYDICYKKNQTGYFFKQT